jgi:F0F1-type ATP synthase assembly protein I
MLRPMPHPANRGTGWSGVATGWAITSTMLAGMLVWGGIGYLADRLIWSSRAFTAIGVVLGAACGTYLVYLRYGRDDRDRS